MSLKLTSEFGTLQLVLTHRPSSEIERLTPYNRKDLLFEDVPYLEEMQKEHDEFTQLIKSSTGAEVLRLHGLLVDVLMDERLKTAFFENIFEKTGISTYTGEILSRYSTSELASILIAGIKVKELKKKYSFSKLDEYNERDYLVPPNPNLYFMRDPAAVVQNGVICSSMKFSGRQRESNFLRLIFENHPLFRDDFNMIYPTDALMENTPSIEGGDVIVLSKKALAIGCSERTDIKAIEAVAQQVFKNEEVERVYEVDLPAKRNFMHLDTVFTIIDENLVVTYPDAMNAILQTCVYKKEGLDENGLPILHRECINKSFITVLKEEIPYLEVIETGDGNVDFASREQWYDGANVFAISPRRVISYNRNKFTNRALKEAGVEVLETSSSELSRGLGGPRCMTMPLKRKEFK